MIDDTREFILTPQNAPQQLGHFWPQMKTKSTKTIQKSLRHVHAAAHFRELEKSDATLSPVSQTTDPAVDAAGLFENQIRRMKMDQQIAVGDTVVWREGMSRRKKGSGIPLGIANCKVLELGNLGFPAKPTAAAKIKLPWQRIKGGPIDEWLSQSGIHEGMDMWVVLADLEK